MNLKHLIRKEDVVVEKEKRNVYAVFVVVVDSCEVAASWAALSWGMRKLRMSSLISFS